MCGVRYVTLDIKMMRTLGTYKVYVIMVVSCKIWINTNALSLLYWFDIWLGKKIWELVLISFLVLVSRYRCVVLFQTPHSQQPATQSDIVLIAFENLLGSCLHFNLILHTRVVRKVTFHLSRIKEDSKLFRRQWLRMCWHRRSTVSQGFNWWCWDSASCDGDFSDRLGSSHVTPWMKSILPHRPRRK